MLRAGLVLIGGVFLWWLAGTAAAQRPAEAAFAGTWRITALLPDREQTLALLAIEARGGRLTGRFLAANVADLKTLQVIDPQVEGQALRFKVVTPYSTYLAVMYAPKNEARPNRLLGSYEVKGRRDLLRMEKTDARDIDFSKAMTMNPAMEDLNKVLGLPTAREKEAALRNLIKKYQNWPHYTLPMALELLELALETKPSSDEVEARIDQVLKLAGGFGREMELQGYRLTAQILLGSERYANLALMQAQVAEKMLTAQDSPASQLRVLKTLRQALKAAQKSDPLSELQARIDPLEEQLDQEEEQAPLPFEVRPHEPRPEGANQAVVVELFNGVHQLPQAIIDPSVSASLLFLGLHRTYPASEVILMQHHLHIPDANPIACECSETRALFYGINFVPAFFINGKQHPSISGALEDVRGDFDHLRRTVDKMLADKAPLTLQLHVERDKDQIKARATVEGALNGGDADVPRLHLFLVEERVRYQGSNGQRLHVHVVRRHLPLESSELKPGPAQTFEATLDLEAFRQQQAAYWDKTAKTDPFPDDDRPLALKKLKIIGLVQMEKSKAIRQAALAEVPEAKPGD